MERVYLEERPLPESLKTGLKNPERTGLFFEIPLVRSEDIQLRNQAEVQEGVHEGGSVEAVSESAEEGSRYQKLGAPERIRYAASGAAWFSGGAVLVAVDFVSHLVGLPVLHVVLGPLMPEYLGGACMLLGTRQCVAAARGEVNEKLTFSHMLSSLRRKKEKEEGEAVHAH